MRLPGWRLVADRARPGRAAWAPSGGSRPAPSLFLAPLCYFLVMPRRCWMVIDLHNVVPALASSAGSRHSGDLYMSRLTARLAPR